MYDFYQTIKRIIEKLVSIFMLITTVIFLSISAVLIQYLQTTDGIEHLYYVEQMIDILQILWLIFIIERILYFLFCCEKTVKKLFITLLIILIPPLRFAARRCHEKDYIFWGLGWQQVDQTLYQHIEKQFLYPILGISICMIPLDF
ncbi:hypothetical protein QUF74_17650 [Candidatus Halobeggiatoa sp. HSG11]|nr:hypothetical protein [Candidatus Halobeggiatoa sp. HSG11]